MNEIWTDHFSHSQLVSVEECPYAYYLLKAAGIKPVENAFAQAGILAHQLLEGWAKGEIAIRDLPVLWTQRFNQAVTAEFPHYLAVKGYATKLFESILTYFKHFEGFPDYVIVGAEQKFQSSIAGERFVGIADLILRNKNTGKLVIVDFKSCSLSSFKKNKVQMYRQLLLYSKHCADTFGEFPEKLRFELIKENTYDECPFDREDFVAARLWAETVINDIIKKDLPDWFEVRPEFFRCTNLCNCRNECIYGKPENHKRKGETIETRRNLTVA